MAYKIHHLNCATLCPATRRLTNGEPGWKALLTRGILVCHCLLIETDQGLVLVDTGFSQADIRDGHWRNRLSFAMLNARMDETESAVYQIRQLGYRPQDVTDIIVTHLDFDHASGIRDFPHARVHVYDKEFAGAALATSFRQLFRYPPSTITSHGNWTPHRLEGERWFGFEKVTVLSRQQYDILLIPLHGHSIGHCGVAVSTTDGWLLHCGDAYFHKSEMAPENEPVPQVIHSIESMIEYDRALRLANRDRLAQLAADPEASVRLFCSHDHSEFELCCQQPSCLGRPAQS